MTRLMRRVGVNDWRGLLLLLALIAIAVSAFLPFVLGCLMLNSAGCDM